MKIAQVAPLWELVPPATYGGTELVVHLLTEELVRQGHEVTLFAAKGSETSATLEACAPAALRTLEEHVLKEEKTHASVIAYEIGMMSKVIKRAHAGEFDVIHNHVGFQMIPFADFAAVPVVTTLHNALNPEIVKQQFYDNAHLPLISISNYQQTLWPGLNYADTIYHGINLARFNPCFEHEGKDYLAFLGRLSPEKGPQHAIRIAKALGKKLLLAGKVDRVDKRFYENEIAHHIDGEQIQYIGELNHEQKVEFLRNAEATLCPVQWAEPFGLVMIESMACGTPVFALRDGSIPEVVDHGKTGFVSDKVEDLIEALRDVRAFDRREIRRITEQRFSMERMASDHINLYERLISEFSTGLHHRPELLIPPASAIRRTSSVRLDSKLAESVRGTSSVSTRKPVDNIAVSSPSRIPSLRVPASGLSIPRAAEMEETGAAAVAGSGTTVLSGRSKSIFP